MKDKKPKTKTKKIVSQKQKQTSKQVVNVNIDVNKTRTKSSRSSQTSSRSSKTSKKPLMKSQEQLLRIQSSYQPFIVQNLPTTNNELLNEIRKIQDKVNTKIPVEVPKEVKNEIASTSNEITRELRSLPKPRDPSINSRAFPQLTPRSRITSVSSSKIEDDFMNSDFALALQQEKDRTIKSIEKKTNSDGSQTFSQTFKTMEPKVSATLIFDESAGMSPPATRSKSRQKAYLRSPRAIEVSNMPPSFSNSMINGPKTSKSERKEGFRYKKNGEMDGRHQNNPWLSRTKSIFEEDQ